MASHEIHDNLRNFLKQSIDGELIDFEERPLDITVVINDEDLVESFLNHFLTKFAPSQRRDVFRRMRLKIFNRNPSDYEDAVDEKTFWNKFYRKLFDKISSGYFENGFNPDNHKFKEKLEILGFIFARNILHNFFIPNSTFSSFISNLLSKKTNSVEVLKNYLKFKYLFSSNLDTVNTVIELLKEDDCESIKQIFNDESTNLDEKKQKLVDILDEMGNYILSAFREFFNPIFYQKIANYHILHALFFSSNLSVEEILTILKVNSNEDLPAFTKFTRILNFLGKVELSKFAELVNDIYYDYTMSIKINRETKLSDFICFKALVLHICTDNSEEYLLEYFRLVILDLYHSQYENNLY